MDPVDALSEIAFWLERELAPTFKVKAFRRAADTLRGLAPDELATRHGDGRLRSMPGIGGRTAEVIGQAMTGLVPDYLAAARERGAVPLVAGGETVRAALRGDLHSHSTFSDGGSPIPEMVAAAALLGREYVAVTDHSPGLTIAHGLSTERLEEELAVIASLNDDTDDDGGPPTGSRPSGTRVLTGIEVDILEDGSLDQTPDVLDRLDVVVASVHSKLRADRTTMTRRMLRAVADPHTDVLGHCTGRLVTGGRGTRPPSDFDADAVFAACAEHGVAVEINSRPERVDPPDELIGAALEAGCLFSIDSDAHAPGQLDFLQYGAERAERLGVPTDRIVTTWPVDRLLDWTRRHR